MHAVSSTLRVGDRAPDFRLKAANRFDPAVQPQNFSLAAIQGWTILEFLRGTW